MTGRRCLSAAGDPTICVPSDEPEIRRLFPRARIARIPEAGHWLHAEQPQAFLELVEAFLAG